MRHGPKPRFFRDGVLIVDKHRGPTSHDAVDRLRRRFAPAKLGHAGTLDPFAEGVLLLVFNRATRLSELLGAGHKLYRGVLALGQATDSGDPTGEIVASAPVPQLSRQKAEAALKLEEGKRLQAPPPFSAAKHQGKPLYAYARRGIKVEKPPRPIEIFGAKLLDLGEDWLEFEIRCSRGTYLRSLAEDIASTLGTVGHLRTLSREESSPFTRDEAKPLKEVCDWMLEDLEDHLIGPSEALARCGLPEVNLDEDRVWEIRQGRILGREVLMAGAKEGCAGRGEAFRVVSPKGELVAVLRWLGPGEVRPGRDYETIRVFPGHS
ncbi:MAG: tRNA pseudouridine(55) synthase TruB [Desulfarculaceae bacterium]